MLTAATGLFRFMKTHDQIPMNRFLRVMRLNMLSKQKPDFVPGMASEKVIFSGLKEVKYDQQGKIQGAV